MRPDAPRGLSLKKKTQKTLDHVTFDDLVVRPEEGTACLIVIRGRSMGLMVELDRQRPALIGRDANALLTLDDMSVSRRHAVVQPRSVGYTIDDIGSTNGVFVNGVRTQTQVLQNGDRIQVGASTILKFCFQDDLDLAYQRQIYDSATRDALTGVLNRRFLEDALEVDFAHAHRSGWGLCLMLLDIDHFKRVNDRLGHSAGDAVLRHTAEAIQRALRPEDLLARYGGEEFAVLLRFTSERNARRIAERIRAAVEREVHGEGADAFGVTISVGLSTLVGGEPSSARELVELADGALYDAKQQGRNRVLARHPSRRPPPDADEPVDMGATNRLDRVGSE